MSTAPTTTEDTPGVKQRIDALNARITELQGQVASLPTLQTQLAEAQAARVKAERNAAFATYGVTTPSARRGLTRDYEDYAKDAGDKATPFEQWLNTEGRADSLYADHFKFDANGAPIVKKETPAVTPAADPAAATPPATPVVTPAPGNPNGGAIVQPPVTGKILGDDDVRKMDNATWAANSEVVKQQLEQGVGGLKVILPKPRAKA